MMMQPKQARIEAKKKKREKNINKINKGLEKSE